MHLAPEGAHHGHQTEGMHLGKGSGWEGAFAVTDESIP